MNWPANNFIHSGLARPQKRKGTIAFHTLWLNRISSLSKGTFGFPLSDVGKKEKHRRNLVRNICFTCQEFRWILWTKYWRYSPYCMNEILKSPKKCQGRQRKWQGGEKNGRVECHFSWAKTLYSVIQIKWSCQPSVMQTKIIIKNPKEVKNRGDTYSLYSIISSYASITTKSKNTKPGVHEQVNTFLLLFFGNDFQCIWMQPSVFPSKIL